MERDQAYLLDILKASRLANEMIHDYDDVDLHIVWQTVQKDLPRLIAEISPLVPDNGL